MDRSTINSCTINFDSTYLMGRLLNRDGNRCANAKLFPLPYQTLAFFAPARQGGEAQGKEDSVEYRAGNAIKKSRIDSPIAHSDKYGMLNYFATDSTEEQTCRLTGSGVVISGARTALFFPTYLVPMAQASYAGNWLQKLSEKLESDALASSKVNLEPIKVALKKQYFLDPDHAVENTYTEEYKVWHNTAFGNLQSRADISIIEIPQYYTIVLTFSAEHFADGKVTLSDFSSQVRLAGDAEESSHRSPVSMIKSVIYLDKNGNESKFYAATFWIETELLEVPLTPQQQYCRFDIDLNKAKGKDSLVEKGVPLTYNLKEQVLHLPIQTMAGRSMLVNGDPISVEEALVNHAPQYFTALLKRIHNQPTEIEQKQGMEKVHPQLLDSMWHHLQTHKSIYEAGAGMLEHDLSWKVISQTYSAAFGIVGATSDASKFVKNLLGISGSAAGFIDMADKFTESPAVLKPVKAIAAALDVGKNPAVVGLLDKVSGKSNKKIMHAIPTHLYPYVGQSRIGLNKLGKEASKLGKEASKLGKVANKLGKGANKLLGPPLSIAELMFNLNTAIKQSGKVSEHNKAFKEITKAYTSSTQSLVNQMKLSDKQTFNAHKNKLEESKDKLQKALIAHKAKANEHVVSVKEKFGDVTVQLINVGFSFDKAAVEINEAGNNILETIAGHLRLLDDPIGIKVVGHTCSVGRREYNMALSLRRAETFKKALIAKLINNIEPSDEIEKTWNSRIEIIGRGEQEPLVSNENVTERKKNRRVEVVFLFNTAYQYPPCRSGISAIENQRQTTVAANVSGDAACINVASNMFDSTLGLGAMFLGSVGISAYALWWSGNLINTGLDMLNQAANPNFDNYKQLKQYSELGVMTQNMLLANDSENEYSAFIKKAYLKRALAINGLVRLIHRFHYEKNSKPQGFTYSAVNPTKQKSFSDYDFEGYINHFLLNDIWEIGDHYLPVYLDEVWLQELSRKERKNVNKYASLQGYISGAVYFVNKLLQGDVSKDRLAVAQNYQSTFPIHYLSSKNIDSFKELFVDKIPQFDPDKKKGVIKKVIISARPRGSKEQSDWQPLSEYLKSDERTHHSLSPYDQIRILVIFNNKEKHFADLIKKPSPLMIPVSVKPIRVNLFVNDIGNTTTEYVTKLRADELCEHEKEDSNTEEKLYGAIIQPKFQLGANIIPGTRPMADYEDSTLESLFFDDKQEEDEIKHNAASGHFSMNYLYRLFIPGTKVDTNISYGKHSHGQVSFGKQGHGRISHGQRVMGYRYVFPLTLDPERAYKVKVKTIKGETEIEVKDDHLLYDKNFLEADDTNKPTYPKIFEDPKIVFSLYQKGRELVANKQNGPLPLINFDWNADAEIIAFVYTKSLGTKSLIAHEIDTDVFPLNINLLAKNLWSDRADSHVTEFKNTSGLHRLGMIKLEDDKAYFDPSVIEEPAADEFEDLKAKFSQKSSAQLTSLLQDDGSLFFKENVDTDVFAVKLPLEYINAVGKKMKGLKPVKPLEPFKPYDKAHNKIYLQLKLFSFTDSGLDSELSNQLIIQKLDKFTPEKQPSNWFEHTDENKANALARIATNESKRSDDANIARNNEINNQAEGPLLHNPDKLTEWIKAGDAHNTKVLSKKRIEILEDWIKEKNK